MKKLIVIAFLFPFVLCAQTQSLTINKKNIGKVECSESITITSSGDTARDIIFAFRNEEYQVLKDYQTILIPLNKKEITLLIEDLKQATAPMSAKGTILWDRGNYLIQVYDWTQKIYLRTPEKYQKGYVTITNKQAEKIIDWLTPLIPQ